MRTRLADLAIERHEGVVVVHLRGEIDSSNAPELRLAVLEALSNDVRGLVLDLTEVSYLDSTAIALVFELARGLEARRQELRVAVADGGPVRRVIELCAVGGVAAIDPDPAASIAALRGSGRS